MHGYFKVTLHGHRARVVLTLGATILLLGCTRIGFSIEPCTDGGCADLGHSMDMLMFIDQPGPPLEEIWEFNTPANYLFESKKLSIANGMAQLLSPDQLDDDNSATGFGGGVHQSTLWDPTTDALTLATAAMSGVFESRIMDAGASVSWSALAWDPAGPYLKNLPDNAAVETAYSSDNMDMSTNVLLLHLDEGVALGEGATFMDTSGSQAHGTLTTGDGENKGATGTLAGGIHFDGIDDLGTIPAGTNVDDFTVGDGATGTWAAWIRRWDTSNGTILYKCDNNGSRGWWLDIRAATADIGFAMVCGMGNMRKYTTDLPPLGEWFHFAVTWSGGTGPGGFRLFLNGKETTNYSIASGTCPTTTGHLSDAALPLFIGRDFNGDLDEIAIWSRGLAATEVEKIYLRGARQLRIQVRTCADASCPNTPFSGPRGDGTSYYSELQRMSGSPARVDLKGQLQGRYLQYRVLLDSPTDTDLPRLSTVELLPAHFDAAGPTLSNSVGVPFTEVSALEEVVGPSSSGLILYQLSDNGVDWFYNNGGSWTLATSATDANAAEDLFRDITPFLSREANGMFFFRASLVSRGGIEPTVLDRVRVIGLR
ncbi:MAG: LamG domain-containing protein [Deltaproteobacteria bacterium]|nr:LamG domain-containing protein [Deltaproteobacteria bacterium]